MVLPCLNDPLIVGQVQPAINLLSNLDVLHPDILLQHSIQPKDYKAGLVFRSAVESIRGTFIASATVGREALVKAVLEGVKEQGNIVDYEYTGRVGRHDFTLVLQHDPDRFAALEVKGGEGNSINISVRPRWASEFGIWCHLDGAIVNQPAHGAKAVVNRLIGEMVKRHKQVDVLFFKDILCGTHTRPCPKYPGRESQMGLLTAPDVFLFPQRIPQFNDPEPPTHTLETLSMPKLILAGFGVAPDDIERHLWRVSIKLVALQGETVMSEAKIEHQGQIIGTLRSRPWGLNP